MITDPISDMLTRIRNNVILGREEVSFPSSKLKLNIIEVLKKEGYISNFREEGEGILKKIVAKLKYDNKKPAISVIERVSKPGRRIYTRKTEIPSVLSGKGTVIISTSKGIMTGKEAKKGGLGGEVLCKIY